MGFREGNKVEVMRRNEDRYCSWIPAKISSIHGDKYSVRYDLFLTAKGKPVVESVHKEDVRPCPPPVHGKERWIVGDVAEVFDLHSWRVGKVAKVLNSNNVVIRLFGSIQLREFHVSSLRVRQAWHNNQWVVIGKVSGKKQFINGYNCSSSKYNIDLGCEAHGGISEDACAGQRYEQEDDHFRSFSPARTGKKNLNSHCILLPDVVVQGTGRKRKANPKVDGSYQLTTRPLPRKVDAVPLSKDMMDENCQHLSTKGRIIKISEMVVSKETNNHAMHPSSIPLQIIEENNACSVASCSGNNLPEYTNENTRKYPRDIASSFFDDAMSSCPSEAEKKYRCVSEDELAANIHELELHAYQSTVKAFYALGPLSWEQESLLTNLRLSLHISNEEHLHQLRHLLSA
ncbi:uncharacterized protein LOC103704514 [Phoenix dactylifera]|uniref:Uncharacterized protein LOC103704514 n=1 Tax=Phoenix dactylifera TaxID=42345 RepID=A0A8B7BV61_PHODC|nr:uncharacterized protein LOC103704514 [Phoenix dactylifera]XP_038971720.1 uncharacterized protein LOC103704514 [Phoenix dactylifera]